MENENTQGENTQVAIREETITALTSNIPLMDDRIYKRMGSISIAMASASIIPQTLRGKDFAETQANCFQVVNFAVNAGMDPFAVGQCASVIRGRLCFEGKLVNAMIQTKGIDLDYKWNKESGDDFGIVVSATIDGKKRSIEGTVGDWKTTRDGTPWIPKQYKMMLAYRGAREWCRLYRPGIMLGVYSDDEMDAVAEVITTKITAPSAPKAPKQLTENTKDEKKPDIEESPKEDPAPVQTKEPEKAADQTEQVQDDEDDADDPAVMLLQAETWFNNCEDREQVEQAWENLEHMQEDLCDDDAHTLLLLYKNAAKKFPDDDEDAAFDEVQDAEIVDDEISEDTTTTAPSAPSAPSAPVGPTITPVETDGGVVVIANGLPATALEPEESEVDQDFDTIEKIADDGSTVPGAESFNFNEFKALMEDRYAAAPSYDAADNIRASIISDAYEFIPDTAKEMFEKMYQNSRMRIAKEASRERVQREKEARTNG